MAGPYYVDVTTGNDLDDGLSEGNAFETLEQAADTVGIVSQAEAKVWVKASAAYEVEDGANDCNLEITTVGTTLIPVVWEGYKDTPGDGGIVKINADPVGDQYANAVKTSIGGAVFNVFINFDFQGGSSHGFNANGGVDDNITFKNCRFYNNGGAGILADNDIHFFNCIASNNTGIGFACDVNTYFVACIAHTNTIGFESTSVGHGYNCLAYGNSSHPFSCTSGASYWFGCTADAEGGAGDNCFSLRSPSIVVNSIAHDGDNGIISATDDGELVISAFNVFNSSNTADTSSWLATSTGDGTGNRGDVVDPANLFGAGEEAARTYSPGVGAQALAIDSNFCNSFWTDYNDGAGDNPPAE